MASSENPKLRDQRDADQAADSLAFPLSFAQQRLWFLDQLEPASGAYHISLTLRLRGNLDVAALERGLNEILRRHDALRTCFPARNGKPVQVISSPWQLPLPEVDLRGVADERREAEALRLAAEEAGAPFDLAHGPLVRGRRLRLAEDEHVLLLTMHHIVSDGWSRGVLLTELAALYDAFRRGRSSPLPELPIQYADYALWEQEWLRGEVLDKQLAYWREQLAHLPVLELPTDRPRPPLQSFRGAHHSISFSKTLLDALRELSRREGATLYTTLLSGFQALLSRYTGQEDIVVGSAIASRTRREIEALIGFFVSTLVLRTDCSGDPSFRKLLWRVREVTQDAYAYQDMPFEKLVQELQPERDLSLNPLFQVIFASQNAPGDDLDFPGLTVTDLGIVSRRTRFDLEVHIFEKPDSLTCTFVYATDLFDPGTIVRMGGHYQTLLEGVATDPDRRIWELPLITEAERRQVVEEWNQTRMEYPQDETVHGLFEKQVGKEPEALAVILGRERMSYRELNERANRLARYLSKRGVGPEVLVGLCAERSLEMVIGLLGILKAGGAYVPLDPGYPRQRLAFMLEDAAASLVLTQENLSASLPEGGFERVRLDADWAEIARESAESQPSPATAENLAYVIYTSGSTGTPKGTAVIHRSVVNLIWWHLKSYSVEPTDRATMLASPAFDGSVWEIWPYLAAGSSLHIPDEETRSTPARLSRWLESERITICFLPTPLAQAVLAEPQPPRGSLRFMLTGGDQLRRPPDRSYGFRLINHYGPTETTVVATAGPVLTPGETGRLPSIGRPIFNTRVYILDPQLRPVPIGLPGELHIAGEGLARGYLNRPELTAQQFVPDPFSRSAGAHLYKTGDLARYRDDGTIEFLGRIDHQVKIRGFRIEPGEIESAIAQHPAVGRVVVAVREGAPGEPRLIAYVVPKKRRETTAGELRGFLESRLPGFMLPSAFVFLDALPLSPTGKIDRNALPTPNASRPELADVFVAPRNNAEKKIARIWCQILGLERVGVHDNFFDLGGHSLLAVRLLGEIEKNFGRRLALATIFRAPTVAELAEMFQERRHAKRHSPSLVAVQPKGTKPAFFCVHANTGIVYYRGLARHLGPDQPFFGLQSQGLDGTRPPYETVEQMAAHYVKEIREFQPEGRYYLGGHSFGGRVAFEMARQLHSQGQRVALLALFDTSNFPLNPEPTHLEFVRDRTRLHMESLRRTGPKQKVFYLLRRAETLFLLIGRALSRGIGRSLSSGYEAIFDPLRRAQRKVLEANDRAARRYVPGFYQGQVTVFRAKDRWKDVPNDRSVTDPRLGWGKLCGGGVEVHEVPGGHSSILQEEANVRALAKQLSDCLRIARETAPHPTVGKNSGSSSSAPQRSADSWSVGPV